MSKLILCAVLLFTALVSADSAFYKKKEKDVKPCHLPENWSALVDPLKFDEEYKLKGYSLVWMNFDFKNQRIRYDIIGVDFKKEQKIVSSLWVLYKEGKVLYFDRAKKSCYSKSTEKESMHKLEIEKNATFLVEVIRGNQNTQTWKLCDIHMSGKTFVPIIEVTKDTCIPMMAALFLKNETVGVEQMFMQGHTHHHHLKPFVMATIANFEPLVNPFLFDAPAECAEAKTQPFGMYQQKLHKDLSSAFDM